MLEIFDPVSGQGWSLWSIITGFAYLLHHLYRSYGHFTPFAGTYYDRPVYSHHFSLDLGLKEWGFFLKKTWIESTKFIEN